MSFSFQAKSSAPTCSKASRRARRGARRRITEGSTKRGRCAAAKRVEERLAALKELIPSAEGGEGKEEEVAAERLFEETADYILTLRTRVEVLKRLVELYGLAGEGGATESQRG